MSPSIEGGIAATDCVTSSGNFSIDRNQATANARAALSLIEECGSLAAFFWRFRPETHRSPRTRADWVGETAESTALGRELKRRGFRFVGPTTAYSTMQAAGIVNDHAEGCCVHGAVAAEQAQAAARFS